MTRGEWAGLQRENSHDGVQGVEEGNQRRQREDVEDCGYEYERPVYLWMLGAGS